MISLLLINYRSAPLAREAIRTARAAAGEPLQVVVVDNSEDPREADALRDVADVLLVSPANLGYAAGINFGRKSCTADVLIVTNPDVTFSAGSLDALAAVVRDGASVAGPALFWDDGHEWHLPPADLYTAPEKLGEALATRSRWWRSRRDRHRIRERIRFWSLTEITEVRALSGAVMAIRAAAFDDAGGFDERFPLYFEENDFLRRVEGRVVYVPAARCRHLYNQSAAGSEDAARKYAQSELAYLHKWNGGFVTRVLKGIERPRPSFQPIESASIPRRPLLIEASPLPDFATAAGRFTDEPDFSLPAEVAGSYRGGELYLRVIDRESGTVLAARARGRMPP